MRSHSPKDFFSPCARGRKRGETRRSVGVLVFVLVFAKRETARETCWSAVMFFCQLAQKVGLAILSGTPPPLRRDTARAVRRASVRSTSDPRLDERDGSSVRAARPFGTARSGPRRGRREGIEICSLKIRECSHLLGGRLLGGRLLRAEGRDGLRGAHGAGGLRGSDHGSADEGGHGEHFRANRQTLRVLE